MWLYSLVTTSQKRTILAALKFFTVMRVKVMVLFLMQLCLVSIVFGQTAELKEAVKKSSKGDVAILELRLNAEDEFRTIDGSDAQGLARIALFLGTQKGVILSKGFKGFHEITELLSELSALGWELQSTYAMHTQSLMITHYVLKKTKK